jgi:hypothetical protein
VINYGVDLPFGHGEMFLNNSSPLVNAVVGGWRVNGITTLHSGLPVPFNYNGTNYLSQYFGSGPIRPNVVAGLQQAHGRVGAEPGRQWLVQHGVLYRTGSVLLRQREPRGRADPRRRRGELRPLREQELQGLSTV